MPPHIFGVGLARSEQSVPTDGTSTHVSSELNASGSHEGRGSHDVGNRETTWRREADQHSGGTTGASHAPTRSDTWLGSPGDEDASTPAGAASPAMGGTQVAPDDTSGAQAGSTRVH